MGEIVNLGRMKKRRARAQAAEEAASNRALHGRTKAEKQRDAEARARLKLTLDGARLERAPGDTQRD